jgi:UDP-N-acetylglucosamine 1-carboxyvinyltransferase
MDVLFIEGPTKLVGRVRTGGSKNAVLPIMAASLLSSEECRIKNVPEIEDVALMGEILSSLGASVAKPEHHQRLVRAERLTATAVDAGMARKMRASFLLMGAILARMGEVRIARPGGDDIGMRRVEQHIEGLRQMGAEVYEEKGQYVARAARLRGATIHLDMPTVTGTENLMMAATLAEGTTTIMNAAREPHVVDLAMYLLKMGARIQGAGTDQITIDGVTDLSGASHNVIPDQIEAGTFALAVAATGGEAVIEDVIPSHLRSVVLKLRSAGVEVDEQGASLWIRARRPPSPTDLTTWPHPGFPTDLQAPFVALMTQANGRCIISEAVFENRFQHVPELCKLGARITLEGRSAIVQGGTRLRGGRVRIPDIRSGAALVIAGMCAEGYTELESVYHLDRGYEDLEDKLSALGARLHRQRDAAPEPQPDLSGVVGD